MITAVTSLYLNVFVLIIQAFQKIPTLKVLAPTQSEPPFAVTQGIVFGRFHHSGNSCNDPVSLDEALTSGKQSMPPQIIFPLSLLLGYVAWLLCFRLYILPRLRAMEPFAAHRAIATLHSFRFIGLVFIILGVAGAHLPSEFADFAAHWDLAAGVLALLALLAAEWRPLFWTFVVAFNLVGATDLVTDYYHAVKLGLPPMPGELGATYFIVILVVPLLMITHAVALYWLILSRFKTN